MLLSPGYTDNDEWLEALARYVSSYKVVRKVELLPYHTMGTYKYEQLGLDYPLKGVEPLSKERLDNAKAIFSRYKPENNIFFCLISRSSLAIMQQLIRENNLIRLAFKR